MFSLGAYVNIFFSVLVVYYCGKPAQNLRGVKQRLKILSLCPTVSESQEELSRGLLAGVSVREAAVR